MSDQPENLPGANAEYGADSIKVLKGLDPVSKRPGMFIGDTDDGSGLHQMVYKVVDNAIGEALASHASLVTVSLKADGSCTVTDNGCGIPTDLQPNAYNVFDGLHGVGASVVVNALSVWLKVKSRRNGRIREMSFTHGDVDGPLRETGDAGDATGTEVSFLPSPDIFTMVEFDYKTLEHGLRELALLNCGVRIVLTDRRHADVKTRELLSPSSSSRPW